MKTRYYICDTKNKELFFLGSRDYAKVFLTAITRSVYDLRPTFSVNASVDEFVSKFIKASDDYAIFHTTKHREWIALACYAFSQENTKPKKIRVIDSFTNCVQRMIDEMGYTVVASADLSTESLSNLEKYVRHCGWSLENEVATDDCSCDLNILWAKGCQCGGV